MKNRNYIEKIKLALNLTKELVVFMCVIILIFVIISIFGHQDQAILWSSILIIFSSAKIYFLVSHTFKKLDNLLENNHSFKHMVFLLGAIITLLILSFSIDYLCVSQIYTNAFYGIENGDLLHYQFFNLIYFSIVTFTTVGYGDIAPLNPIAKIITVFEMMSAFVVIMFVISKYFRNK